MSSYYSLVIILSAVKSSQIGSVLDDNEGFIEHNHINDWSIGKFDFRSCHCHLHFCRNRNAIVLKRLHVGKIFT